jgi:hypothetical protein
MMASVASKAKDIAKEDARKAQAAIKDAITSRAYLYPLKVCVSLTPIAA